MDPTKVILSSMNYELTFIVGAQIPETEHPKVVQEIVDHLEKAGAKISKAPYFIGRRKLAYPIQKQKNGFYASLDFDTDKSQMLKELDTVLKHNTKILRHLVIKKELGADDKKEVKKVAPAKKSEPASPAKRGEPKLDLGDIDKRLDQILAEEPKLE